MKRFLIKIIIYSAVIFCISFFMQYMVDSGLQKYHGGNFDVWNDIFDGKIDADIIIQGSSRALVQFDPNIIEKTTGLSCYNLGISGGRFVSQKAKWDSYLAKNKAPKIILQNVDILSLRKDDYIFNKVQYLPYLSYPTISSNLQKIDRNIWIEKIIPLYKYRGFRHELFLGLKSFFGGRTIEKNLSSKGYVGVDKKWNQDFAHFKLRYGELILRQEKLKFGFTFLEELIKECKSKGIDVVLVHSPVYSELLQIMPQKPMIDSLFIDLSEKYKIQYWDYTDINICSDKNFFYNSTHLNSKGSEIFTEILSKDLNSYIQKKYENKTIFAGE